MNIEEKIASYLKIACQDLEDLKSIVAALAEDPKKRWITAFLKKDFQTKMGMIEVSLWAIEEQLGQNPLPAAEIQKLHARFDGMEELIKANAREIGELKKKLPE